MQIRFQTEIGMKRKSNQDDAGYFYNQGGILLAIVADGMGGHQAGDIASKMVVTDIGHSWESTTLSGEAEISEWLQQSVSKENQEVVKKGEDDISSLGMGTTIVLAVFLSTLAIIAHVGDSRCYLFRDGKLEQLTEDHSLVNELVKQGEISEEMAAHHPRKNVLLRSVGVPGDIEVDVDTKTIEANDVFLICTDGLTNMLTDSEMTELLKANVEIETTIQELIDHANQAGGTDNITALMVKYD